MPGGLTNLFCPIIDPGQCGDTAYLRLLKDLLCQFEEVAPCEFKEIMVVPCATLPNDFAAFWTDPPLDCLELPDSALVIEDCAAPVLWRWNGVNWVQVTQVTAIVSSQVLNNDVAQRNVGDLVIWDTTADQAVTGTVTPGHILSAGVVIDNNVASLAMGRIAHQGIVNVNVGAAVVRGDRLQTSAVKGEAQARSSATSLGGPGDIIVLQAGGPGLVPCYINIAVKNLLEFDLNYSNPNTITNSVVYVGIGPVITVNTTGERVEVGGAYGYLNAGDTALARIRNLTTGVVPSVRHVGSLAAAVNGTGWIWGIDAPAPGANQYQMEFRAQTGGGGNNINIVDVFLSARPYARYH
jgi:hypothetical protein